jgi:hypothetical protein
MQSLEALAGEKIENFDTLKDWSSSDKTLSEGKARRVSAGSANQFQQFVTPDDGRKFTELYNVQHLQSAQLDRVSRVCISTIQRLYSMLRSFFFSNETLTPQRQFTRWRQAARYACSTKRVERAEQRASVLR